MKLEVLLSGMYIKDYHFIDKLNIQTDCVVINQCDESSIHHIRNKNRLIKFISTKERGLSKSRNMAIKNATADICILCDDDVQYVEGYEKIILNAFRNHPECDILVFYIKREKTPKPLFDKPKRMNFMSVGKIGSPQIVFRREAIKGINFKEEFGSGSKYAMGEESIFMNECLRRGIKIKYIPTMIAHLRDGKSRWFKGYNEKYFYDRGACFYATSNFNVILASFKIIGFSILRYDIFKRDISFMNAVMCMFSGMKEYRKEEIKNND